MILCHWLSRYRKWAHLCASWGVAWGRWSGRRPGCRSCRSMGAPLCAPACEPSAASAGWTCWQRKEVNAHAQAVLEIRDILTSSIPCFFIQVNKKCLNLLEWLLYMTILKLNLSSIIPIGTGIAFRMRTRILGSVLLTNGSGYGRPKNIRNLRFCIWNTGPFTSFFKDIKKS